MLHAVQNTTAVPATPVRPDDHDGLKTIAANALAHARTDKERALIQLIFEGIPGVRDLQDAHSRAEREGRATELAERRWQRASRRVEAQATRLINLPAEDAASALRRFDLHKHILVLLGITSTTEEPYLFEEDQALIVDASLKALRSLAEPNPRARRIWDAAAARLDAALKRVSAEDVPETEWDALSDQAAEIEGRLHRLPAPDFRAVTEKLRLSLRYQVEFYADDSVDDPRTIAVALSSGDSSDREIVLIYQDLLRLTGQRPEIASVTAFDPSPFVDAVLSSGAMSAIEEDEDARLVLSMDAPAAFREAWAHLRTGERKVVRNALKARHRTVIQ